MHTSLIRAALRSVVILVLVLMLAGSLFAQESTFAALTPASRETGLVSPVETASTEPVPSAPGEAAVFPDAPMPVSAAPFTPVEPAPVIVHSKESASHPFWDRENTLLFTTVAGLAAADFYATHANLASGGKELNPVTRMFGRSTPGLASNFALETGSVIGVSYLFHRTGHHRLERLTAVVNIGASAAAVGYSFSHR